MRPFRPVRRTRRDRTRRRARRRPADHRRDHRDRRAVLGVGSGRPAHPATASVGMGAGALVDRRPTQPRGRHPASFSTGSPPEPAHRSPETIVAGQLAESGFLGDDQRQAVSTLCGPGGSVRTVLAPAGYGKTAMAHAAAGCATADGRPVIAVATTAKAVAELDAAGLPARTIARFRYDLADGPLAGGDGRRPRRDLPDLDPRRP